MHPPHLTLDLRGASDKQISAIEARAKADGVCFEEAAKRMLLELADKAERKPRQGAIARLFRFPSAHQK